MKTLKKIILKGGQKNAIQKDSEMKKVRGGGWDSRCRTTCSRDGFSNARIIAIENCMNCYVTDGVSVSCMQFIPDSTDMLTQMIKCSSSIGAF